jgi:two-component system sensor histidine kinase PhoQ
MGSIHSRLLIASSLVLAGFLGITGFALDRAFQDSVATAARENLQTRIYALLAAADADAQGRLLLPEHLPERRLSEPDSGLYAMVISSGNELFWQSASLVGRQIQKSPQQAPGSRYFHTLKNGESQLLALDYGVSWEDDAGAEQQFTFVIAEDMQPMQVELEQFRKSLWRWLGGLAIVLLLAQGWILRWGLHPLRGVAVDLRNIQQGTTEELQGDYPRELRGLTSSLNELLAHASSVRQRYRNSLDDLAHSLKTPLAFLRSVAEDQHKDCKQLRQIASEQVERMDTIVQCQLQRAAASGRITLAKPLAIEPIVQRLVKSLNKIYQHKGLAIELRIQSGVMFRGDQEDLMEMFGNLLENAFKFAGSTIRVSARHTPEELLLSIEDDGPGIPAPQMAYVVQRGGRADQALPVPGQGLGLALVDEIVSLYDGKLEISDSELGGARLILRFPLR